MSSFLIAVIACFEGFTAAKRFGVVGTPEMGLGTAIWLVTLTSIWFLRELMGSAAKTSKSANLEAPATDLENPGYATPARGKGIYANITEDTIADDGAVQEIGGPTDDDDEEGGGYLNIAAATDSDDPDDTTTPEQSDMDDSEGEDDPLLDCTLVKVYSMQFRTKEFVLVKSPFTLAVARLCHYV